MTKTNQSWWFIHHQTRGLIAVLTSVFVVGIIIGLMFPLLSLVLKDRGYSYSLIGIHGSLTSISILLFGALMPKLIARYSPKGMLFAGCFLLIMSWLGLGLTADIVAWFVLRFLLGAGICIVWMISETWLNNFVTNKNRGHIMGLYGCSFSGGMAMGPLVLNVVGTTGFIPFLTGASLVLIAVISYFFISDDHVDFSGHDQHGVVEMAKKSPSFFITGICAGFVEVAVFALLPLYGEHLGLTQTKAISLFTFFVSGSILLQPLVGWGAGKFGAQKIILICAVMALVSALSLPLVATTYLLLSMVMFLWGGAVAGLYISGVVGVGHYFQGKELAAANSGYIMMYALGMLLGPSVSGIVMEVWPQYGYIVALSAASFLCIATLLARGMAKT